jgi:NTP pyrophosphatase (non-canonical NTP hydrolase)
MDMVDFSFRNLKRCQAKTGFNHLITAWSLSEWMVALTGEIGEAANIVKKLNRARDGMPGNTETGRQLLAMLGEELADAFTYLDLTATCGGYCLAEEVAKKFLKVNAKIGYVEPGDETFIFGEAYCGAVNKFERVMEEKKNPFSVSRGTRPTTADDIWPAPTGDE